MNQKKSSIFSLALLTASVAGFNVNLIAQNFYGSIVGTITDASGASIVGAKVNITSSGTGETHQTQSGAGGDYQFLNLVPGIYRVDAEQNGFKKATRENVEVTVSGTVRSDISMQLGDVSQSVEVQATSPLLQTENANLSQVVNTRSVEELPVNGRNIMNLTEVVPGVVPQGTTSGDAVTGKNIFAAGNYQIGGGAANQSATYYDGVPANSALGNLVNMVPSPDAVSEFRVQTNSNGAEYGRYAGGVVNISSKSGTNEYHGAAYEYFRNTDLNANLFFNNAQGQGKAPFHQNQYGLDGGGPIKKNKIFFFVSWEAYTARQGSNYTGTVPLPAMYNGDFSGYKNASGAVIPIYDPLTQCGANGNASCPGGVASASYSAGPARQPFPGNIIPPSRFNPVAVKILSFPLIAQPDTAGAQYTAVNNYAATCEIGGNNNQENSRFDDTISEKLRVFARYSRWSSLNNPCTPMHNGVYANDPYSPESFDTQEAVLGATYLISPNIVLDIRASYVRFPYDRLESQPDLSLSQTFGFPAYMDQDIPIIHGGPGTSFPSFSITGYTTASGLHILSTEDDYLLTPNLSWVHGKHTFKFGADWRDLQDTYYQTFDGGSFSFTNLFTASNALAPGASGNGLASMLLGYGASGSETAFSVPWESLHYQGYYAQDTWQVTNKLTLTYGVRWEIPGVWTERYNRNSTFNPSEVNPALQSDGITLNGQPILGAVDFANTSQNPNKGANEHFRLFAPRMGLAYRLDDKTVIRAGAGIYYLPSNTYFSDAPWGQTINQYGTSWLSTLDGSVTPYYTLSNPFPNGFNQTPGNLSHTAAQAALIGGSIGSTQLLNIPFPYNAQWNLTIQRQLPGGAALEVAYAGSKGTHLPTSGLTSNALPYQDLSMGTVLTGLVPNPFASVVKTGSLSAPTVQLQQLLLPFPEYTGVSEANADVFNSSYHSLQMKVEKRFSQGGSVLASYTFSKLIADVSALTGWLDSGVGAEPGIQNPYNLTAEKSLAGFDSRQRLTVSYALDLPFGPGHKYLVGGNEFVKRTVGGWTVSGISTFQDGFPLALTATGTSIGTGYGRRPNVTAGCNPVNSGSATSLLGAPYSSGIWFNVSCYSVPAAYTLGDESATDPVLRGPGIANYDFSLAKKTRVTERFNLQFRAEFYNIFNRVQFGQPNTSITTAANPTTGFITSQINQPRTVQLNLRLSF